jgi:hypothetical protein
MAGLVPFPCVVYTRNVAGKPYSFSHCCSEAVKKLVPPSLKVQDLVAFNAGTQNWEAMRRACFLVLVAGDTAQCVSVANALQTRTPFLYKGSSFSRPSPDTAQGPTRRLPSELHETHIPLHFYSTLSAYDSLGVLVDITPVECGITLLPHTLLERDIPNVTKWVESNLLKSLHTSVWLTEGGHCYCELNRSLRVKRKSAVQLG